MNGMHMSSLSPNGGMQQQFSARNIHDNLKEGYPLSDRLKKGYNFTKLPPRIYPEIISITETTDSNYVEEIDVGASPPIDESLFFENVEPLRNIGIDGVKIYQAVWNTMSAAEMKVLREMENGNVPERDGILFPDVDEKFRNIAFTWACIRGLSDILPRLEASGADINNVYFHGPTPSMYAAFYGKTSCLKYLIERGADINYVSPRFGHCALHSAAAGNCPQTAAMLLDNGGDLNNISNNSDMIPLLQFAIKIKSEEVAELFINRGANPTFKNLIGETPLHVACSAQSIKCCERLLEKPEVDVNALDEMNRTPLHYAVMVSDSNIKLVETLLKHGALVNTIDKTGYSPLHVAALEEHTECVQMLIWHGADVSATTGKGVSALNIILRKIPESFQALRIKMDLSIRLRRLGSQNRELEMRFDFGSLHPSDDRRETSFLKTFIQENLTDLLSHPLVTAFLYLKWERIRKFYLFNIFFYTVMVIFMSIYVLTALAYKCYNSSAENNTSVNGASVICFYFDKRVVKIVWYIWLFFVCMMIPRKILSFTAYKNFQGYLWSIDNILDTINIISVFATSFIYTGKTDNWQNYVGAFSVLCAWINLMFVIGQMPKYGAYVAMFTHIQFEFAKLLFAYSGLIIGFTLSFCVIFDGEPSFANLLTGLVKILTMNAGELDFEGIINLRQQSEYSYIVVDHPFYVFSQIIFSLFVVFIVVILMNLLVGIAVHDIKGLRNQAGHTKLGRATKLIIYAEFAESKMKHCPFLSRLISNRTDTQIRKDIFLVRPLNPLEKRLPREILKAAYDIAQETSPILDDEYPDGWESVSCIPKKTEEVTEVTLDTAVEKLESHFEMVTDQMHELKDQLSETERILEEMVLKLS